MGLHEPNAATGDLAQGTPPQDGVLGGGRGREVAISPDRMARNAGRIAVRAACLRPGRAAL